MLIIYKNRDYHNNYGDEIEPGIAGKAILDFFVLDNTLNVSAISKYGR